MNLVELQNKIHQQNVEMGWWDNPRPFSTFVCLFHSELSEAMEGDRKGLMDDHLPQYEMFWVELGDFVIRCLDYLGSVNFSQEQWDDAISTHNNYGHWRSLCHSRTDLIANLHHCISSEFEIVDEHNCSPWLFISNSVLLSYSYAIENYIDLNEIIIEKVEYNKHRADHKRENREKDGGKKY